MGVDLSSAPPTNNGSGSVIGNFAKGAGISAIGRVVGRGFGYLGQVILARILLPEAYGLFALAWTLFRLISIVSPLGLDNGIIRFGSRYWKKDHAAFRGVFIASLVGAFVFSILIGSSLYLSSPWLAVTFFHKPLLEKIFMGFALMLPLATLLRVLVAASSISQRMFCGSMAEDIIQPFVQIIGFFSLLNWLDPIIAAVLATGFSFSVSFIVACICAWRQIPHLVSTLPRSFINSVPLFRYSLASVAAVTFGVLNIWGDRLIVGYYRPESDVGIYQSASLIAAFLVVALSGVKAIMAPVAARLYEDRQYGALNELIKIIGKWIMILSFPFVLVIIFAPDEILWFILGSQYEAGASLLVVLIFAQLVYVVFGVADQILLMTGHHKDWLLISASTFFVSLVLNLIFVPRYGLLGAAFVSLSSSLMVLLISIVRIGKLINIWPYDRRHLKPLAAAIVTGMLLYFVMPLFSLIPIYKLLLTATISLFAFCGMIFMLGIDVEDKNLIRVFFLSSRNR